ncbi:GNAT family N-acetyltransferase [Harryflintia acetispora]|uniref:GNAT family N-acetyltransferase n=1 Tax=Harryflintia acetispora TaxID=1849041 RepID=UPI00189C005F
MIRFVDSPARQADLEKVLAGEDLIHACMLSSYYNGSRRVGKDLRFWVCYEGEEPCAALLSIYDEVLLCDGGLVKTDELEEFLRFLGCEVLCGRGPLLRRLAPGAGLRVDELAPAMVYRGGALTADEPAFLPVEENFSGLYRMIGENYDHFFDCGGYEGWLADYRFKRLDGVCQIYAYCENGAPVATGALTCASGRCADLGGIVVRRDHRGRGLGQRMVRFLIARAREHRRLPVLCCAGEELLGYYRGLSFEQYDEWACALAQNT